jgi:tRNA(Ile)-lysidine synthase
LADLLGGAGSPAPLVLVAVSGGADSTALLQATCFVGPRLGLRVGALVVDHGLQPGSFERARAVAGYATVCGADPVQVWHVHVDGPGGPEAAARSARREAFAVGAHSCGAAAVLLGHTRDDQAETVLLGLARGSGTRSLAGMASRSGLLRRPLLGLPRDTVRRAALLADPRAPLWEDPHNADPAFTRARVRARVLPLLEAEIGPGVSAALARTATLARADADALDAWAAAEQQRCTVAPGDLDAIGLSGLPDAVRTRVLRRTALAAGCPASDLSATHVAALDTLVRSGPAGASTDLPGGVRAQRDGGRLVLSPGPARG